MKKLYDYIVFAITWGFIAAVTALIILLIENNDFYHILRGDIIYLSLAFGMIASVFFRLSLEFLYSFFGNKNVIKIFINSLIYGISSFIFGYVTGTRNLIIFIIDIGLIELLGHSYSIMIGRYRRKLNDKLKETQERYKDTL